MDKTDPPPQKKERKTDGPTHFFAVVIVCFCFFFFLQSVNYTSKNLPMGEQESGEPETLPKSNIKYKNITLRALGQSKKLTSVSILRDLYKHFTLSSNNAMKFHYCYPYHTNEETKV